MTKIHERELPVDASATSSPKTPPISVMVVDDSAVIRGMIIRILTAHPDIEVVASMSNGEQAVRRMNRAPTDVVVLDIEMPVMDGLTALPLLLKASPNTKIIMASALTQPNARVSLQALREGAADYIPKPSTGVNLSAEGFKRELVEKVKALGRAGKAASTGRIAERESDPVSPALGGVETVQLRKAPMVRPRVLAVGSSTGGPNALFKFLSELDTSINVPIFVTQHMPPTFTGILAENLSESTQWQCQEAKHGEIVNRGKIYLAPGDYHMTVGTNGDNITIRLNQGPKENFCRPAVDPMLRSISEVYGSKILTAILTGMGADGRDGCKKIAQSGGTVIAQDKESSVVWGMPGAVAKDGLCSALLPPKELADFVNRCFQETSA